MILNPLIPNIPEFLDYLLFQSSTSDIHHMHYPKDGYESLQNTLCIFEFIDIITNGKISKSEHNRKLNAMGKFFK